MDSSMFPDFIEKLFTPALIGILSAAIYMGVIKILKSLKEIQYNDKERMAEIQLMRKSYEDKIYKITEELESSKHRWMDINHLVLSNQKYTQNTLNKVVPLTPYLESLGLDEEDLKIDDKSVFFLTPFHPRYRNVFNVVKNACSEIGLKCYRGDEEHVTSDLMKHIIKQIVSSRLVIAHLDGRNPNVFYELGIAHAIGKKVILLSGNIEEVPFDIRGFMMVIYENEKELDTSIKQAISKALVSA